jgi:hypothetical protein
MRAVEGDLTSLREALMGENRTQHEAESGERDVSFHNSVHSVTV